MTTPDTCPECDRKLQPAFEVPGTGETYPPYCTVCERTWPDLPDADDVFSDGEGAPRESAFTIPWECMVSVNKRSGGIVGWTRKEYREKRDAMTLVIRDQYDGPPHTDEVKVGIELYPPNLRSDPHNFQKVIMDSLEHAGVIEDDKLVTRWTGMQCYVDKEHPRAYVTVERRK